MTNGELALNEQFLFLPQRFQKSPAAEVSKRFYKWERVNNKPSSDDAVDTKIKLNTSE